MADSAATDPDNFDHTLNTQFRNRYRALRGADGTMPGHVSEGPGVGRLLDRRLTDGPEPQVWFTPSGAEQEQGAPGTEPRAPGGGVGRFPTSQPPSAPGAMEVWSGADRQRRPVPDTWESGLDRAVRARHELARERDMSDRDARILADKLKARAGALVDSDRPITAEAAQDLLRLATRLLRATDRTAHLEHALRSVYGPAAVGLGPT